MTSQRRRGSGSEQGNDQFNRFKEMARRIDADESDGALERVFYKIDPKKRLATKQGKQDDE